MFRVHSRPDGARCARAARKTPRTRNIKHALAPQPRDPTLDLHQGAKTFFIADRIRVRSFFIFILFFILVAVVLSHVDGSVHDAEKIKEKPILYF